MKDIIIKRETARTIIVIIGLFAAVCIGFYTGAHAVLRTQKISLSMYPEPHFISKWNGQYNEYK